MYLGKTSSLELVALCELLARDFINCGNQYFKMDKNATVKIDPMLTYASQVIKGVKVSKELKDEMYSTSMDWHWHGW